MKYKDLTYKIIGCALEVHKHLAQKMNYVEANNLEIGLLLNFGSKSLQFKRVHNNNLSKSENQKNQA